MWPRQWIYWCALVALTCTRAAQANDAESAASGSAKSLAELQTWLSTPRLDRKPLADQAFAGVALSKADAAAAQELLWNDHVAQVKETDGEGLKSKIVKAGDSSLKIESQMFPAEGKEQPEGPRALFISMHGGGGAPPQVNDSQWVNQLRLGNAYRPVNAVYVAPRAPSDSWDLWHTSNVDLLFQKLIANLVATAEVDPNQVYLMGYSAGGDGAYQLAPRMADQLAAASAMAGHPNNASPRGLRNLPFTIHVGGNDTAYGRNKVASDWNTQLDELQKADPKGYEHFVHVHEGKGHWMDMDDKAAIPWMQKFRRNPRPEKIVWRQGNTVHDRFYWLSVDKKTASPDDEIVATRDGQSFQIEVAAGKPKVRILLNDALVDLDQPVTVQLGKGTPIEAKPQRTIGQLYRSISERGDPESIYSAEVVVE